MTAGRMAPLREKLAGAADSSERLAVLAEMIGLAAELGQSDSADGDDAAAAAVALDDVLRDLGGLRAPDAPPLEPDDHVFALYLTAQACLLRDGGSDLDDAIACLRELRDELLAEPADPDDAEEPAEAEDVPDFGEIMAEVEVNLGQALFQRAARSAGGAADLDDASAALRAALDWTPSDAPARPSLIMGLAWCYGLRYIGFSGTQDHRLAGLAVAAEGLAAPDATEDVTAACHVIVAWLTIARQLTSAQRTMLSQRELEAVRSGGADLATAIAGMDARIDPADAQTALRHLRQVPAGADLAEDLRILVPCLEALAHIILVRSGQVGDDVGHVAERLQDVARQQPPGAPEQGELLAMGAVLKSARASSEGHRDEFGPAADALQDAAARLPESHPMRSPLLDQLGLSLRQQVDHAESAGDLPVGAEQVMAMLEQTPADDPGFARALTVAAVRLLAASHSHRGAVPLDRLITQLERTVPRLSPDDPARQIGEAMRLSAVAAKAAVDHQPGQLKEVTAELRQHAEQLPADSLVRLLYLIGAASGLLERFVMTGELRLLKLAEEEIKKAADAIEKVEERNDPAESAALGPMRGQLIYLQTAIDVAHLQHESGDRDPAQMAADMDRAGEIVPPGTVLKPRMNVEREMARVLGRLAAASSGSPPSLGNSEREAFAKILAEAQSMSRNQIDFPATAGQAAGGLMMRGIVDRDKTAMAQGIALLAEACSIPGLTVRERPRMLNGLGFALLTRYDLTRDPRDLSLAIDRLEEARRAVEQQLGSPEAASVLQTLASAYRIRGNAARGDIDRAVTVGLDALRERAGDVLLQDDDADALMAGRRVTSDASVMARWFLAHGRASAAIEALEYGRGTVLHAATSSVRVAEALAEAGHADLAAEWMAYMLSGEAAEDLRYRVMTAIEGSVAEAWLLAPPSLGDITAALRASHADTLAYLLPHGDDGAGLAVLVDVDGNVSPLFLPRLRTGPGSPVHSFLRARRAAGAEQRSGERERQAALGELCDWAWDAATRPLLDAIPARSRGSRRVVLVPAGELGLVAWHAARQHIAKGSYRYAAQEAVFTYASSARQFVTTAGRQPRPWAERPVLISDAQSSLLATAHGICHLHEAYYPEAAVFGYARFASPRPLAAPGSDAATEEDVLDALAHGACPAASVLHFGCHGSAEVPVLGSRLNLGEGHTVAVERILAQARKRPGQAPGGLVVLASCLTDVAEADYDEAVTLATAFLSAGAAGVVAARWAVPERATALFMAAFHHYLNEGGQHPAQALRSAQVWMLDPGRAPLRPLPKILRDEVADPGLADPLAWAGFAYQGW